MPSSSKGIRVVVSPRSRKALKRPRTKKKGKLKKIPLSRLKRSLDAVFSLYVRAKYPKQCYTCPGKGKTLQCGHFISRSYLATRWNEDNCRPQCVGCNIWGRGKLLDFEERLKSELGEDKVEEMKRSRRIIWKLNRSWYEAQIKTYQEKLASLT